jgi:hypothetical protein
MKCVVIKEFVGAGQKYVRNQLIDSEPFRNAQVLITQRYMRPATQEEIASARPLDEDAAPPVAVPLKARKLKARVAKRA